MNAEHRVGEGRAVLGSVPMQSQRTAGNPVQRIRTRAAAIGLSQRWIVEACSASSNVVKDRLFREQVPGIDVDNYNGCP